MRREVPLSITEPSGSGEHLHIFGAIQRKQEGVVAQSPTKLCILRTQDSQVGIGKVNVVESPWQHFSEGNGGLHRERLPLAFHIK